MSTKLVATEVLANQSVGIGTFGEGIEGNIFHRLFRVVPDHDLDYVLEQSSRLMGSVYKLTLEASLEQDDTLVLAAYYLSGMAKALTENVAMARMLGPEEGQRLLWSRAITVARSTELAAAGFGDLAPPLPRAALNGNAGC